MKRILLTLFLILALVGCTPVEVVNEPEPVIEKESETLDLLNEPKESEPKVNVTDNKTIVIEELVDPYALPQRSFSVENLTDYFNKINHKDNNYRVVNETDPYGNGTTVRNLRARGETLTRDSPKASKKNFLVHAFPQSFESQAEYYDTLRGSNWDLWKYWTNETWWNFFHEPLSEKELKEVAPNYKYKVYTDIDYTTFVKRVGKEQLVQTKYGPILRYYFVALAVDKYDFWRYNWNSWTVVYKIPCTEDLVVYHKPEWGLLWGGQSWAGQKLPEMMDDWEYQIETVVQDDAINFSEHVMEYCGILNTTLDGFQEYEVINSHALNWRVYFRTKFNYTFNYSLQTEPYRDEYRITGLNLTFNNMDEEIGRILEPVYAYFSVKVRVNESGRMHDYVDKFVVNRIGYNEEKEYTLRIESKEFSPDATVIIEPYMGKPDMIEQNRLYFGSPIIVPISS